MGLLDRVIKANTSRAESYDATATAARGIKGYLSTIGRGLRKEEPRDPQDRERIIDPREEGNK